MNTTYTVSDVFRTFENGLSILAGAGGMARQVSGAGYLDYELDPVLKDKYFHTNFQQGQLVITTFSTAKENPYMILDAVKHLIEKGCSGLIIKNVYHLPIHDTVLRYADAQNFPIISIDSMSVYVEDIIAETAKKLDYRSSIREKSDQLGRILEGGLPPEEIGRSARIINPSGRDQYRAIYVIPPEFDVFRTPEEYEEKFRSSRYNIPDNVLLPYQSGFFVLYSREAGVDPEKAVRELFGPEAKAGVSSLHLTLAEMDLCLRESIYAARSSAAAGAVTRYEDLGIRQCVLPFAGTPQMRRYMRGILKPVMDYGIENNVPLYETLLCYLNEDLNMTRAAEVLHQHKNTVRYRLEKISALTGLDYRSFRDLEELAFACHIQEAAGGRG